MTLQAALYYARRGWRVLPLRPNGKAPATEHGVHSAVLWQPSQPWPAGHNLGVAVPDDAIVIDVDVRNGGLHTIESWPHEIDATPIQVTASGGTHWILRRPAYPVRGKAGAGVDVLGRGRYIVAAPSTIDGIPYRWRITPRHPLALVPDWLELLIRVPEVATVVQPVRRADTHARAEAYARAYPPAISGQGGHTTAYKLACALVRGFGLSSGEALTILAGWSLTCQPPWSVADLRHKVRSAERSRLEMGYLL